MGIITKIGYLSFSAIFSVLFVLIASDIYSQSDRILGQPVDMSSDFSNFKNTFSFADKLASFDPVSAKGKISWKRTSLYTILYY